MTIDEKHMDDLTTILQHRGVSRLIEDEKLDEDQLQILNAVAEYPSKRSLPEDITAKDVVFLARHFQENNGTGSAVGRILHKFAAVTLDEPTAYYAYGRSLGRSSTEAITYYKAAADAGDLKGLYHLALIHTNTDRKKSYEYYQQFLENLTNLPTAPLSIIDGLEYIQPNDFSRINDILGSLAARNIFRYTTEKTPYHNIKFTEQDAKYWAIHSLHPNFLCTVGLNDHLNILTQFSQELHNQGDPHGVMIFVKAYQEILKSNTPISAVMYDALMDLDHQTNGAVAAVFDDDKDGMFDALKQSFDEYKQNFQPKIIPQTILALK